MKWWFVDTLSLVALFVMLLQGATRKKPGGASLISCVGVRMSTRWRWDNNLRGGGGQMSCTISSSMLRIRFGVWSSDIIESSCLILVLKEIMIGVLEIFGGVLLGILYALGNFWQLLPVLIMEWNSRTRVYDERWRGFWLSAICEVILGLCLKVPVPLRGRR